MNDQAIKLKLNQLLQPGSLSANKLEQTFQQCFDCLADQDCVSIDQKQLNSLLIAVFDDLNPVSADEMCQDVLRIFSKTKKLTRTEFNDMIIRWLKPCIQSRSALIVVDVQNDFISGSLSISASPAGQNGFRVVPIIQKMLETVKFDLIVFTQDWHPKNHISFVNNLHLRTVVPNSTKVKTFDQVTFQLSNDHRIDQVLWPEHCVQNTWGAEIHQDLSTYTTKAEIVYKGEHPEIDSYSAFYDNDRLNPTRLNSILKSNQIDSLYICGLATDVCVAATAQDALTLGYRTVIVEPACAGLDPLEIQKVYSQLNDRGAVICYSLKDVQDLISGHKISSHLARFALQLLENNVQTTPEI